MVKKPVSIRAVFILLLLNFILLLGLMFIPTIINFFQGMPFLIIMGIFFLLGGLLTFLVYKQKLKGKPRRYLLLTGFSAVGFFVFAVLHNLFYALAELSKNIAVLPTVLEYLHATFFIISVIICPIGFVIGVIGSIILLRK
jgi:hypothetical protein